MQLTIGDILSPQKLESVVSALPTLSWADGQRTAGAAARSVKNNLQADVSKGIGKKWATEIGDAVRSNPVVRAAARPKRLSNVLLSRTEPGGGYGPHLDNAVLGQPPSQLRSDLSFTLFLSYPEDYDGGELTIHGVGTVETHKPALGDLVLYPSGELHEVAPVTRGTRYAAVGWIESVIRDASARAILFDLENLRTSLRGRPDHAAESLTVDKIIGNLLRRWVVL